MSNKNKHRDGIVYSTDPDFQYQESEMPEEETLLPGQQRLKIRLDRKMRKGKSVTLVEDFTGTSEALDTLGKALKQYCGCGGSVKDGSIIIQGDHRQKIAAYLSGQGYKYVFSGG